MKLTTTEIWDSRHKVYHHSQESPGEARCGWLRRSFDDIRTRRGAIVGQSYNSFALHTLLTDHLPRRSDWSVIEIGAAPGGNLVKLNHNLGYQPYGVEYSDVGVEQTRQTFQRCGFDPTHVIHADLFDREFQKGYESKFNVVFSLGFIEHFDPPDEVIELHANLVKPGGYLVCQIPNLRGFCYPLLWLLARDHLAIHNCEIMRKEAFCSIFDPLGYETKFCDYVGGLDLHVSQFRRERSFRGYVSKVLDRVQDVMDHSMFLFGKSRFPPSPLSAGLLFIGRRMQ